jgi:hypothetical protein
VNRPPCRYRLSQAQRMVVGEILTRGVLSLSIPRKHVAADTESDPGYSGSLVPIPEKRARRRGWHFDARKTPERRRLEAQTICMVPGSTSHDPASLVALRAPHLRTSPSRVGACTALQAGGHRFDPGTLHLTETRMASRVAGSEQSGPSASDARTTQERASFVFARGRRPCSSELVYSVVGAATPKACWFLASSAQ